MAVSQKKIEHAEEVSAVEKGGENRGCVPACVAKDPGVGCGATTANSLDEADIVVGKLSHILVLHEYWTLGLYQRSLLPDSVISGRGVFRSNKSS